MLKFKKFRLGDYKQVTYYRSLSDIKTCELSAGTLYMWRSYYKPSYAIIENTMIVKKESEGNQAFFFFPLGENVDAALDAIDDYVIKNSKDLVFVGVEDSYIDILKKRYNGKIRYENKRAWCDYIYDAKEFREFKGKKYDGQRNHINAFLRLYPDHKVKAFTESDVPRAIELLKEYAKEKGLKTKMARSEFKKSKEATENFSRLSLTGIYVEINGKMVSYSLSEKCGKTQIIHVEKALRSYKGLYPFTANAMAKYTDAELLNREDDSGDLGLRKSKLQYKPIYLLNRNVVTVIRPEISIKHIPTLFVENLTVSRITDEDLENYLLLNVDDQNNKWWGYDYRDDIKIPTKEAFKRMLEEDFNKRHSFSFGIHLNGNLIGEAVFYNFKIGGECEVGLRLFKEYQGKGYGKKVFKRVSDFLIYELKMSTLHAKCFKQNIASKGMITYSGFTMHSEDDKFFYFKRNSSLLCEKGH